MLKTIRINQLPEENLRNIKKNTKPVKEILSVQETAKDMDINVKSNGENSEDESVIHPSPIKRKRVENENEPA